LRNVASNADTSTARARAFRNAGGSLLMNMNQRRNGQMQMQNLSCGLGMKSQKTRTTSHFSIASGAAAGLFAELGAGGVRMFQGGKPQIDVHLVGVAELIPSIAVRNILMGYRLELREAHRPISLD